MQNSNKQLVMTLYHIDSQRIDAQVLLKDDSIWATQRTIAEIFGVTKQTINQHINNIFAEGELLRESTIKNFLIVQREGNREVSREIEHYNLDMIISVGYRGCFQNENNHTQYGAFVGKTQKGQANE